ncbi:S8 family serine peptidase [Flavobacterium sp. I3-2]|uniref:S8 family serine peptidase n=1 Tax=Flavobacterium sp. I3-2 TaxID=2748319 RepID=UPI0015A890CD|nr:S8 family serine peptidase [Flavobacterium sp. I3-2]
MNINKSIYLSAALALALASCSTQKSKLPNLSTLKPIENADHLPTRKSKLSEEDLKRWSHLDIINDTIPGMSVDRAYAEIIKDKVGNKVIVAVIDSGIEIDHEDLKPQIYNKNTSKAKKKKNKNNIYKDDIHGWNFLGKSNDENLEMTRIVKKGDDGSMKYKRAKGELDLKIAELEPLKERIELLEASNAILVKHLGKDVYTKEDLETIVETAPEDVTKAKKLMGNIFASGRTLTFIDDMKDYYKGQMDANLNVNFDGRAVVGDNPYDINDVNYGDNDVMGDRDHAKHGTHVAGIIAQSRNNGLGGDGVASEVTEIMSLRAVPNGDEYDKDIALAIRYAADNGAKVINGSFGKYFSQNNKWVQDAIKYAASKDVLIVVAAGNDALDLNPLTGDVDRYPNDRNLNASKEFADNFLVVGALNPTFGEGMIANFSNFGKKDVDVFAPGVKIYATTPYGKYEYLQGTSMASPNVAGVAALIRSYYPNLTANQVKQIIMDSGVTVNQEVIVSGNKDDKREFEKISTSGKFVNAYNALILADKVSRGK